MLKYFTGRTLDLLKPLNKKEKKAVILATAGLGILAGKIIGGMLITALVNMRDRLRERKYKNNAEYPLNTLAPFSTRECLRMEIDRGKH